MNGELEYVRVWGGVSRDSRTRMRFEDRPVDLEIPERLVLLRMGWRPRHDGCVEQLRDE